jgi:PAS domain-containing protein
MNLKEESKKELINKINVLRSRLRDMSVGSRLEIMAVCRDINVRGRAEEHLRQSRNLLISILNGIDTAVYMADMKTNEMLYLNKRAKKDARYH